jgi:hypothetical protein
MGSFTSTAGGRLPGEPSCASAVPETARVTRPKREETTKDGKNEAIDRRIGGIMVLDVLVVECIPADRAKISGEPASAG